MSFAAMMDALFADPNMARNAEYTVAGETLLPVKTVRAILRRPDTLADPFGQSVSRETMMVDIRVSEVAAPKAGDSIAVDGVVYAVQGMPQRDAERLVWQIETKPGVV